MTQTRVNRWLALYYLLVRAGNNTLYLALMTMLLKRGGIEMLPWLYTCANLTTVGLQVGLVGRLGSWVGRPLLSAVSWPLVGFSLIMSCLVSSDHALIFLIGLILLNQVEEIGNLAFANFSGTLMSIQEAKRAQPMIYAAGSFGLFVSGMSLKVLLDFVDLREILWANAGIQLAADLVLARLRTVADAANADPARPVTPAEPRTEGDCAGGRPTAEQAAANASDAVSGPPPAPNPTAPSNHPHPSTATAATVAAPTGPTGANPRSPATAAAAPPADTPTPAAASPTIESAWHQPLVRLLLLIVLLRTCNKYLVDYLYSGTINRHFTSSKDLAAFMGMFGAIVDLTVIGVQGFLIGRAFERFRIGQVLTLLPVGMVVFCGAAIFDQSLALVVTLQFSLALLTRSLLVPSNNLLLAAVPAGARLVYQRSLFTASSVGTVFAGGLLLLIRGRVPAPWLFAAMVLTYGIVLVWVRRLDAAYVTTLEQTLQSARTSGEPGSLDEEMVGALRWVPVEERLPRLEELLVHPNPQVRLQTIAEVEALPAPLGRKLLSPMLAEETEIRCQVAIARFLLADLGEGAVDHLQKLIAGDAEPRLVADVLEVLGRVGATAAGPGQPPTHGTRADPGPRDSSGAAPRPNTTPQTGASLTEADAVTRLEALALAHLTHPHHRVRGAAVMSSVRLSARPLVLTRALATLAAMAGDHHPLMRATAAAVMGELSLPLFIPALGTLADDADLTVARNAMNALARIRTAKSLAILRRLAGLDPVQTVPTTGDAPGPARSADAPGTCRESADAAARTPQPTPSRLQIASELYQQATRASLDRLGDLLLRLSAGERREMVSKLRQVHGTGPLEILGRALALPQSALRTGLARFIHGADAAGLAMLDRCLDPETDGTVRVSARPIARWISASLPLEVPAWVALVPLLGPTDPAAWQEEAESVLDTLWQEAIWLESGIHDGDPTPEAAAGEPAADRDRWQRRVATAGHLLALGMPDPEPVMAALDRFRSPDPFTRAIAQEFLDTQLGAPLASRWLPLWQGVPPNGSWTEAARRLGIELPPDPSGGAARAWQRRLRAAV